MISLCHSCHTNYWRYRKDHPPRGFCSYPCYVAGPQKVKPPAPLLPAQVLELMKTHRGHVHNTDSILQFFDCEICESLEEQYAESIQYYVSVITAEICAEAQRRALTK